MNWKRYRNELIVLTALLVAAGAFVYKLSRHTSMAKSNQQMAKELAVLQETVSLKKIWGDKYLTQKIDKLRMLVPSSKVRWKRQGKRLSATFSDLKPFEVNTVITKLLNIAVQVEKLHVTKEGDHYRVEVKCKW